MARGEYTSSESGRKALLVVGAGIAAIAAIPIIRDMRAGAKTSRAIEAQQHAYRSASAGQRHEIDRELGRIMRGEQTRFHK
jgi:hypothetical protein